MHREYCDWLIFKNGALFLIEMTFQIELPPKENGVELFSMIGHFFELAGSRKLRKESTRKAFALLLEYHQNISYGAQSVTWLDVCVLIKKNESTDSSRDVLVKARYRLGILFLKPHDIIIRICRFRSATFSSIAFIDCD